MPFLKGPEGRRKAADGRKENGELLPGRVGAGRRAGPARRAFLFARTGLGGQRPGWVGAASGPAAGGYPQSESWPPPADAAASPKGSILLPGPGSNRPAGLATRVRPARVGDSHRVLLDGRF